MCTRTGCLFFGVAMEKKETKKMGRPQREIDLRLVARLAKIQCTIQEISSILDIPYGTLTNRPDFTAVYKKNCEGGKCSLRRLQFKLAQKSAAMAIFLGKQYLGQKDKVEFDPTEAFKGKLIVSDDAPVPENRVKEFMN